MTNQNDVLVAEAVGYTFWITDMAKPMVACCPPGKLKTGSLDWKPIKADGIPVPTDWHPYESPLPFLSAPTYETDGIVKAWLKNQGHLLLLDMNNELKWIWGKRMGLTESGQPDWILVSMQMEEPGDYAKALLAVIEDG